MGRNPTGPEVEGLEAASCREKRRGGSGLSRAVCERSSATTSSDALRKAPVGIVGVGAVGTSIGLALRGGGEVTIGFDASPRHLEQSRDMGAIRVMASGFEELSACKAIFIAVPPREVVPVSRVLLEVGGGAVIDVASVKGEIADAVRDPRFVPSHPLRGTHLSGPSAGRKDLFVGAAWVVCPTSWTCLKQVAAAEDLIRKMGAEPLRLDPDRHDAVMATTSHLPHVVASCLVHALGRVDRGLAGRMVGGGFLDTTRIARANPALWADIGIRNRQELADAITELVNRLQAVKAALGEGDAQQVLAFFSEARGLMDDLFPEGVHVTPRSKRRELVGVLSPRPRQPHRLAGELQGAH
ncbi:MAG: prephenate dehydrogenase/arogenate dehydrogenase family protein [Actinomycetota bacterium]|nr:prephenate dehydrogenase/arogenate dehydrogenase family protein [Actinomycetota bacterium]